MIFTNFFLLMISYSALNWEHSFYFYSFYCLYPLKCTETCFMVQHIVYPCASEKNVHSDALSGDALRWLLGLVDWYCCSSFFVFLVDFMYVLLLKEGCSTVITELCVLLLIMFNFVSLDFEVLLLGTYIHYTFLME